VLSCGNILNTPTNNRTANNKGFIKINFFIPNLAFLVEHFQILLDVPGGLVLNFPGKSCCVSAPSITTGIRTAKKTSKNQKTDEPYLSISC